MSQINRNFDSVTCKFYLDMANSLFMNVYAPICVGFVAEFDPVAMFFGL